MACPGFAYWAWARRRQDLCFIVLALVHLGVIAPYGWERNTIECVPSQLGRRHILRQLGRLRRGPHAPRLLLGTGACVKRRKDHNQDNRSEHYPDWTASSVEASRSAHRLYAPRRGVPRTRPT